MDPVAVIVGLIMVGAAAMFVLKPFRDTTRLTQKTAGVDPRPAEARMAALSALRALDFDFRTGKVSEEDYPGLRAQLLVEAAKYVAAESDEDDRLERLIRAHKTTAASKKTCSKCGKSLAGDARFCPHCGTALGPACPSCGKPVKSGDLFCRSCGTKLELRVEVTA